MSELLALGATHKTAPLAVRERLALPERRAHELLAALLEEPSVSEGVALFTCNRTELYLVVTDAVDAESAALRLLARQSGIRPTELVDAMSSYRNCEAARHLFRVTSGLDSMVVGEAEIQGQVKRAYETALSDGASGPMTNKLFRAALATGKRVRTQTKIAEGHASVASVAVDLARDAIGPLQDSRVLIIGAGETAEGVARALHEQGVATLFVANRRRERAEALAERFGGGTASLDTLPAELAAADIVIASTSSPHPLLDAEALRAVHSQRAGRPLLLVDLGVPRDIEPSCAELADVRLYDLDDLQAQVARTRQVRQREAQRSEVIVEEEIHTFAGWLGSLDVLPTVAALRSRGDAIVEGVLAENANRWDDLSPRDADRVEAIARAVANRLLHEPTRRLKETDRAHPDRRHTRLKLLRELFGLEAEPAGDTGVEAANAAGGAAEVRTLRAR